MDMKKAPGRGRFLFELFYRGRLSGRKLPDSLHRVSHPQAGFHYNLYALDSLFKAHRLGTCSAQPEMLHAVNRLLTVYLRVENKYSAFAQVVERFCAFRVCAVVYHGILQTSRSLICGCYHRVKMQSFYARFHFSSVTYSQDFLLLAIAMRK
jgi:hypothetical protein